MLNNYLLGKDVTDYNNTTGSGFQDIKKPDFMVIEILKSDEEDVKVGFKVKVRMNAAKEDEFDGEVVQVIHRKDIIRIL